MTAQPGHVRCYVCDLEKPIEAFAPDKTKASGRMSRCRDCDNAARRARYAMSSGGKTRLCVACGQRPTPTRRHHYCETCRHTVRSTREWRRLNVRPSTAARGYGTEHQQLRKAVKAQIDAGGVRCARGSDCKHAEKVGGELVGGVIRPGDRWDLGHDDHDRSRYAGPEHQECNRATTGRPRKRFSRDW